ncbi:MAG: hypothetical protein AAGF85_06380 [Bacteroidota bacterium]
MMKTIKYLSFLLVAGLLVMISCEDDEGLILNGNDIISPTNVSAIFDISDDNTGKVTILPSGEGAAAFEVLFGDVENEDPTLISPGESTEHIYAEGNFVLTLTAVSVSGGRTSVTQDIVILFDAPENLQVDIAQDRFDVTVAPTADGAFSFDLFFGDVENEVPTTIMPGESSTHTYDSIGEYVIRTLARGAGAAFIERMDTVTIVNPVEGFPLDFSTENQVFGTFNGTSFIIDTDPEDATNPVGAITNSGAEFEGISLSYEMAVDFSFNKIITMRFYTDAPNNDVLMKFEDGTENDVEVVQTATGMGWNELSFDFSNANFSFPESGAVNATGAYNTIVLFVDGPAFTAGTFFIDDIAVAPPSEQTSLALDFSSPDQIFGTFNGASFALEMDPFDPTNQVGNIMNSGAEFEGAALNLTQPVDFSVDKVIKMRFFSLSPNNDIILKFENGTADPVEVIETGTDFGWNEISFDFSEANFSFPNSGAVDASGSYSTIVMFVDGPATRPGSYLFDDIVQTGLGLPLDFNSDRQVFGTFNGALFEIVANPEETSDPVGQLTNTGVDFEGISLTLEDPIDFDVNGKILKMNFYTDAAGTPVLIKLEGSTELAVEVTATAENVGWNELTFDFSSANLSFPESGVVDAVGQYFTIVIFADIGQLVSGVHLIDDIKQVN